METLELDALTDNSKPSSWGLGILTREWREGNKHSACYITFYTKAQPWMFIAASLVIATAGSNLNRETVLSIQ